MRLGHAVLTASSAASAALTFARLALASTLASVTSGVCKGTRNVTAMTALSEASECTTIHGHVRIAMKSPDDIIIKLPSVQLIRVDDNIDGEPALELAHNSYLVEVDMPELKEVRGGAIRVDDNSVLIRLAFGVLREVDGDVLVDGAAPREDSAAPREDSAAPREDSAAPREDSAGVGIARTTSGSSRTDNATHTSGMSVELSSLQRLSGSLVLSGGALKNLSIDALQHVGRDLMLTDTKLTDVDFDELATVGGSIILRRNAALRTIRLGSLHMLGGNLTIEDGATSFEGLVLPLIQHIRGNILVDIQSGSSAEATTTTAMQVLDFGPELRAIDGDFTVRLHLDGEDRRRKLSEERLSCTGLRKRLVDSGILRGRFDCEIRANGGRDLNASGNVGGAGLSIELVVLLAFVMSFSISISGDMPLPV